MYQWKHTIIPQDWGGQESNLKSPDLEYIWGQLKA